MESKLIKESGEESFVENVAVDDFELATRAREGDTDAFGSLFKRYYVVIYSLAYRLCGHQDDAEDLAQETFVRAARAIGQFRGDSEFKSWLYRITVNVANNWRRKSQRQQVRLVRYAAETQKRFSEESSVDESSKEYERILAALEKLKYSQRQAIVLTVYEGMSHAEAAGLVGCAETTISWRVFTAKKSLKKALGKWCCHE